MYHILLVDDDLSFLELCRYHLEYSGDYKVDTSLSGEEALSMLGIVCYDAVISDCSMPGMSGLDLLRIVRERYPLLPFLMVTGMYDRISMIEAAGGGADGYLQKGGDLRSLCDALDFHLCQVVERRGVERELRIHRSAIASSISGVIFTSLEGRITYVNASVLRMWGYLSESEVIGLQAGEFWMDEASVGVLIISLLRDKAWRGETVARRPDGSPFDVLVSASLVSDRTGSPLCLMASCVDITEVKRTREALLAYVTEMAVRIREPADLIRHDLNDLLGMIESQEVSPAEVVTCLHVQAGNAEQIVRNINDLNRAIVDGRREIPEAYRGFLRNELP